MTKIIITLTIALMGLVSSAQVSGTKAASGFTGIAATNGIEVYYTQDSKASITVEANEDAEMQNVAVERKGKILKIYKKADNNSIVKVYISGPDDVNYFKASEGAVIYAANEVTSNKVVIDLSTDGQFKGNVKATSKVILNTSSGALFEGKIVTNALEGNFKNGSNAKIHGYAKKATLRCESGAACMAGKLVVDSVSAYAENKSAVAVTVTNSIIAGSDDTSSIKYYGSPITATIDADSYAMKTN
ncbi:MAG: hypothetical protein EOO45_25435 [Flavobacterium sp.]|nr:MAG: hypothetical protein EOO45_25435 [Flavobacterium sp.]